MFLTERLTDFYYEVTQTFHVLVVKRTVSVVYFTAFQLRGLMYHIFVFNRTLKFFVITEKRKRIYSTKFIRLPERTVIYRSCYNYVPENDSGLHSDLLVHIVEKNL